MWIVESLSAIPAPDCASVKYYLQVGVEHVVGRKNCLILLKDDNSISRKHSVIFVDHPIENTLYPAKLPTVKIKDCSKYGTRVNGKNIESKFLEMKDGDEVHFGVFESKFRLTFEPFVVSTSCIGTVEKSNLRNQVAKLGGHLLPEFSPICNYLVMNKITVTMKVVTALITSRHIVTPNYVKHLLTAVDTASDLPDPKKFIPPLSDTVLEVNKEHFYIRPERSLLFRGVKFIVFNEKQFKKLKEAIQLAGGTIEVSGLKTNAFKNWLGDDTCLIQPTKDLLPNDPCYEELLLVMKRHGKRLILEAELCLAVIKCTKVDCFINELPSDSAFSIESQVSNASNVQSQLISDSGFTMEAVNDAEMNSIQVASSCQDDPVNIETTSVAAESIVYSDEEIRSPTCHTELNTRAKRKADEQKVAVVSKSVPETKRPKLNQDDIGSGSSNCNNNVAIGRKRHGSGLDSLDISNVEKRSKNFQGTEMNTAKTLHDSDKNLIPDKVTEKGDSCNNSVRIRNAKENSQHQGNVEPGSWFSVKSKERQKIEVVEADRKEEDMMYGSTVVEISYLIPARASHNETKESCQKGPRNFKTFQKVWPSSGSVSRVIACT